MHETPLRIAMFSNLFRPVVSGSATQSECLARELRRLGHHPFVIAARVQPESAEYEEIDGIPIYRIPARRLPRMGITLNFPWLSWTFTPANVRRIAAILHEQRPDVLHLHNHMFDLAFSAVQMKKRFKLPLIVTIHTMIQHAIPAYNLLLYPADRLFLRHTVLRHADTVICPDYNIKQYVDEAFAAPRAAVCPYFLALPAAPDPLLVETLRQRHGLAGKRVILSLGHVHELRHRRELISILPKLREAVPNTVVVIVGAEAIATPRELAGRLGVSEAVIFTGPVSHDHISAYLALADLEMHLFYQGEFSRTSLGIASMEAMGAGRTVVVAANPDTFGPGVLRHGENIVFVDPTDVPHMTQTLIGLLRDPARCQQVGEAARRFVAEHLSSVVVATKTLQLYEGARARNSARADRWG